MQTKLAEIEAMHAEGQAARVVIAEILVHELQDQLEKCQEK